MTDREVTPYEKVHSGWQQVVVIGLLFAFCVAMVVVL